MATLFLADHAAPDWQTASGEEGFVLGLGVSSRSLSKFIHSRPLDHFELQRAAEERARREIPNFVNGLPVQIGVPYLEEHWRFLEIAEKSLWRGSLVQALFSLIRVDEFLASHVVESVRMDVRDPFLAKALRSRFSAQGISIEPLELEPQESLGIGLWAYFFKACRQAIQAKIKKFYFSLLALGKRPQENRWVTFTFFPFFWTGGKSSRDRFFQGFEELYPEGDAPYYVAWSLPFSGRLPAKGVALERFLPFSKIGEPFSPKHFWGIRRVSKSLSRLKLSFCGFDVTKLVARDVRDSFLSPEFFRALYIRSALKKFNECAKPKGVLFRLEFQPMDEAVIQACRKICLSVGFQHSAISRNFLSYIFHHGELGRHAPDRIVYTSNLYADLAGSLDRRRMRLIGALRYPALRSTGTNSKFELREKLGLPGGSKVLYLASSPLREESLQLAEDVVEAVKGQDLVVFAKAHPSATYLSEWCEVLDRLGKGQVIWQEGKTPAYDAIQASDVVLLTGSSLGVEALALKVPVVVYDTEGQLSNNPLAEAPDAVRWCHDSVSLKEAIQKAMELPEQKEHDISLWFGDLTKDPKAELKAALADWESTK